MPDYIYLLKNRLSLHQRNALEHIRAAAREAGMTVFLVGGAVRDLTSGSPVFDLDVAVQGNALKLKKTLEKAGGKLWGEHEPSRTLFFRFPVGVTVEISSTRREEFPKPGKPVYHWDTILEDLRRRDFTANAMALSLNEHSYGLLMDPLNGVADIEARQLRLVSNYGFLQEPSLLLRATRLIARLGWALDERTQTRFQNAKDENVIGAVSAYHRGYELEEIGHEEDGLRVLAAMEAEGWMHHLFPAWTTASVDVSGLAEVRKLVTQLQMQGVSPDISAASIHFLTAKLAPKDLSALKAAFVRPGFIEEWDSLDHLAREFSKQLGGKDAAAPSATWRLFTSADPQAVLRLGLTSKSAAIQAKYKNFFTVWPEARQKVPHALLQELRITPEVPGYDEMISRLFLGVIDGMLETEDQLRAFLQPYSPPAPPPPVTVRRTRGSKKSESKSKIPVEVAFDGEAAGIDDEDAIGASDAEDDEESEPEVDLQPAAEKAASKRALAASEPRKAYVATLKPEPPPAKAGSAMSKAAHVPASNAAVSDKPAKVHVMAKPAKAVVVPAPGRGVGHPQATPPVKPAAGKLVPGTAAAGKSAPGKSALARSASARSAPAKAAAKTVATKPARGPIAPAPAASPASKRSVPAKKAASLRPPAKAHKRAEPAKKLQPPKKVVSVRKHR